MKTIFLIGFMGSGKSTVASELAKSTIKTYIDTDDYIEEVYQEKIVNIFKRHGEDVFRTYEIAALKEVGSYDVVSTGGGIVEKEENLHTMKENGIIIYLETSFEEITNRLKNDADRPLWDNEVTEKIKLYERRIPIYEQYADYVIETNNKTVNDIVKDINAILSNV